MSTGKPPEKFEALMDRLESIVRKLESNDLPLEDAIEAYQEGVRVAKLGHDQLAKAEQRLEELTKSGDVEPMDPDIVNEIE